MSDFQSKLSKPEPPATPICLQVGEKSFTTTTATLCSESTFFASMFSGRWPPQQRHDGSYFIDADPNIFQYILQYLRDGTLPLFYANGTWNHEMYVTLLGAARYFGIDYLQRWIESKRFLQAVRTTWSGNIVEGTADLSVITGPNEDLQIYPVQTTKKVYVCPRRIHVHRGNPGACGKMCAAARVDGEIEYDEEPVLRTLIINKKTVVNYEICTERHRLDAST